MEFVFAYSDFAEVVIGAMVGIAFVAFILMPLVARAVSEEAARAAQKIRVHSEGSIPEAIEESAVDEFADSMSAHLSKNLSGLPFRQEK